MAVKTLDQVLSELQGTYQPQIDTLRQRQSAIPDQIAQNEQQLQAKQNQAFGDITDAARRRGLGFSGIPLSEQAKYTSTEYLPALANLRSTGQQQAMSLEDAINGVLERRNTLAQQLVQQSQQQDLAERQFQEQIRQFNEQQRAAAASAFSPTYNPSPGGGGQSPAPKTDPLQQIAYNDVATRVGQQSDQALISDFLATQKSANYGNPKDKLKLQIYQQLRPDLFATPSANYLGRLSNPQSAPKQNTVTAPKPYQAPNLLRGLPF